MKKAGGGGGGDMFIMGPLCMLWITHTLDIKIFMTNGLNLTHTCELGPILLIIS